ncbi:ATP-grasp domain-containing protein [Kitasatospora sp. NA04385]|uniref:ATP-grasp domain-containing protein n=1 Tax=Kitasatospora sp. NA04385 TaxID=2742135 RepID=UPI00158FD1A3|nr:ATP-grasp domain-containing protein [Kitasatospora sp. NA04385]QKW20279.1 ATP-grasp domain-containing protein [Kitasatospora sp. NA04385]
MSILLVHKKNLSRRRLLAKTREYAQRHGERLLLIMADPSWEAEYFDRVAVADTTSIEESLAACRELLADEEPITGVVTLSEFCVPTAAAIAAEFGLPSVSEWTAYTARDKFAMRSAFAAAGDVPQPGFALVADAGQAAEQAARFGYPVILKPVIGCHSMFVQKVHDERELVEAFPEIQKGAWEGFAFDPLHERTFERYAGGILVEEFVDGPEISVESLIVDGVTHPVAIHDKPLPQGATFEEVYACTPTRLPADTVAAIHAATEACHRALGITTGASHVEWRLRDGREPVILEAGARMGGGPIYRSVLLSTGVDMLEAMLDLATGRTPVIAPRPEPVPVGFRNIFPERPGTLTEVVGAAEAEAADDVHDLEVFRGPGDLLDVPPNTYEGYGHVIFTAPDIERLDARFAELLRTLRLETRWTH